MDELLAHTKPKILRRLQLLRDEVCSSAQG